MNKSALIAIGLVASSGVAVAQVDTGPEGFLVDLWELARTAGPFGTALMFFMWWRSDAERKEERTGRANDLEIFKKAMTDATDAIKENTRAILFIDRKGTPP